MDINEGHVEGHEDLESVNGLEQVLACISVKVITKASGFQYARIEIKLDGVNVCTSSEEQEVKDYMKRRRALVSGKSAAQQDPVKLEDFHEEWQEISEQLVRIMKGKAVFRKEFERAGLIDGGDFSEYTIPPEADEIEASDCVISRASISNCGTQLNAIHKGLGYLVRTGQLKGYQFQINAVPVSVQCMIKKFQAFSQLIKLGEFTCPSGMLWASDPCYDQDPRLGTFLTGAQGTWCAYSTRQGQGSWGDRSASILIVREGEDPIDYLSGNQPEEWMPAGDCSVDSGQAGFFDQGSFQGSGGADPVFYEGCAEKTLNYLSAGVHRNGLGAVSSSGDGDGGYLIRAVKDRSGKLLASRIFFYEPSPQEDAFWKSKYAEKVQQVLDQSVDPRKKTHRSPIL